MESGYLTIDRRLYLIGAATVSRFWSSRQTIFSAAHYTFLEDYYCDTVTSSRSASIACSAGSLLFDTATGIPLPQQFLARYPFIRGMSCQVYVSSSGKAFVKNVVQYWVPGLQGHTVDATPRLDAAGSLIVFLKFNHPITGQPFGTFLYNDCMSVTSTPAAQVTFRRQLFDRFRSHLFINFAPLAEEATDLMEAATSEEQEVFRALFGSR